MNNIKSEKEFERVKKLLESINYQPVPGGINATVANQFSEFALTTIINKLLHTNMYFPECTLSQEIYMVVGRRVHKCNIVDISITERVSNNPEGIVYTAEDRGTQFPFFPADIGRTVFYGEDARSKAIKVMCDKVVHSDV